MEKEQELLEALNSWADEDPDGVCMWISGNRTLGEQSVWMTRTVNFVAERYPHLALEHGMRILSVNGVTAIDAGELANLAVHRLDAQSFLFLAELSVKGGSRNSRDCEFSEDFDFGRVASYCLAASDSTGLLAFLPTNFVYEWTLREPWAAFEFCKEAVTRGLMPPKRNGFSDFLDVFVWVVTEEEARTVIVELFAKPATGVRVGELASRLLNYEYEIELLTESLSRLPESRREMIATEALKSSIYRDDLRKNALKLFRSSESRVRGVAAVSIPDGTVFLKFDKELRELGHSDAEVESALTIPAS